MSSNLSEKRMSQIKTVALKILQYLEKNPNAMDTETGVAQWWVQDDVKRVGEVLAVMVGQKLIKKRLLNGSHYYQLRDGYRGKPLSWALDLLDPAKAGSISRRKKREQ